MPHPITANTWRRPGSSGASRSGKRHGSLRRCSSGMHLALCRNRSLVPQRPPCRYDILDDSRFEQISMQNKNHARNGQHTPQRNDECISLPIIECLSAKRCWGRAVSEAPHLSHSTCASATALRSRSHSALSCSLVVVGLQMRLFLVRTVLQADVRVRCSRGGSSDAQLN